MEEEFKTFVAVWLWTIAALIYCHSVVSRIPVGTLRLLSLLPVIFLLTVLPLKLTYFLLCGPTAALLTWLCNFKLLLFAFSRGPLSEQPWNLLQFVSIASLPIQPKSQNPIKPARNLLLPLPIKAVLLALVVKSYEYKSNIHPYILVVLYVIQIYLMLELMNPIYAVLARAVLGLELDPNSNEPSLATSLEDFWGRRYNLVVTGILRQTVYYPLRALLGPVAGRKWAALPAAIATFTVSGLMHEVEWFYVTRARPTWEVTWFFLLHGVCVAAELAVKRSLGGRWRLHRAVSGPLTVGFVVVTAGWLFFPQLMRNDVDEKAIRETYWLIGFGKERVLDILRLRQ